MSCSPWESEPAALPRRRLIVHSSAPNRRLIAGTEARHMTSKPTPSADDLIDVASVLLLIQGAVAFVAMVEVGIVAAATGGLVLPSCLLTALGAGLTLALLIGIRRRWRRARTVTVSLQVLWLVGATLDLLLAAFLARRGLELVPTLTRIVLPFALFRIMRKPQVREAFGARPSRRNRRKARRSAAGEPADRATDRLDSVEMPA